MGISPQKRNKYTTKKKIRGGYYLFEPDLDRTSYPEIALGTRPMVPVLCVVPDMVPAMLPYLLAY